MFATAVYGVLDVQRRTWRSTCAGHPAPLLVRPGQSAAPLPSERTQMLLFSELEAVGCNEQALHPGDRIVLYTDGITDREAPDGTLFDEEGLTSALDRVARFAPGVDRRAADDRSGSVRRRARGGRRPDAAGRSGWRETRRAFGAQGRKASLTLGHASHRARR